MTYKEAKTSATYKANLLKVNHVIVKVAHKHRVYTQKQYPNGYFELVEPVENTAKPKKTEEVLEKPIEQNEAKQKLNKNK